MIPRPEYPRPQFVRAGWQNLNGPWQFEQDPGCSGRARGLPRTDHLSDTILVPFCPESDLSGIGNKDFMTCVWYRRTFTLESIAGRTLLHFGAVDYRTEVWINGTSAGTHEGGYVSFTLDITALVRPGENVVTVCAEDDSRDPLKPTGKQSTRYGSYGCFYTRTTGIWQTVWLEQVPDTYIRAVRYFPDAGNGILTLEADITGAGELTAEALWNGERCGGAFKVRNAAGMISMTLFLSEKHVWQPGDPALYDLRLTLKAGDRTDEVTSYFGLRDLSFRGKRFYLNERPVFQRLVLDQGFYPDGIYTAPTDEALKNDILLAMKAGFNGARLHQKCFDPRYLYWADHLGFLCWGEMASWGLNHADIAAAPVFVKEWLQALERDRNSPAIVCWCPFNETWDVDGHRQNDDVLRTVYRVTKAVDTTRPVVDTSGNYHVETDIYDVHDYEQDPAEFENRYGARNEEPFERFPNRQRYEGQPFCVSEYGGIKWDVVCGGDAWGYGNAPGTEDEYLSRLAGLTKVLLNNPRHFGFCYTQLYDVEQECSGIYTYDRRPKFNMRVIHDIFAAPAAAETE